MWPKCRGRRLPVKLTGAPAAPAPDTDCGGGGGGPPLSLVVDCSVQGSETRVQAFAALPTSTAEGQANGSCGCSRKPCCCLPGAESQSTPTTQQQPMDQLRPVTYVPREALFRTLGGSWFHLVPFAVAVGSNEGDRPQNVFFKPLTDNAGEDGDQGVYLVEEPVQETASPVLSQLPTTETNIIEIVPEPAYHVSGAPQQISPTPVTSQQTVKNLTEGAQINGQHAEYRGSQREQVPSEQEPYQWEKPVQEKELTTLSQDPTAKTNIAEMIPEEADNISPRKQVSSTPVMSTQAVGSQQEQVFSREEPPRQSILEVRLETSHRDQQPSENRTTRTVSDGMYREMCGKRLRNFLVDDITDLRSPKESSHAVIVEETDTEFRPERHSHQQEKVQQLADTSIQGTHPVMEDEPQGVPHSQEIIREIADEAPTTEEIIAHTPESPLAEVGELPIIEEAPTTDTHESLSVHSEVDEWETIVVEEVDASTQTSQEWLPISEEPIAVTNDESSPLAVEGEMPVVEAPTTDIHEGLSLHSEVDQWETVVVEEVDAATQTSQEWLPIPQELNAVIKDASIAYIRESPHAEEGELHVIEEAPTPDNYESVVVVEEVDTATQTPQEWLPIPQKLSAVINDAPTNYESVVLVEEVDTATQTPQEWLPIPKELKTVTKDASLAHIRESTHSMEGELHEGSHSHRLEQMATTVDLTIKDSHPVIEDETLDDSHSQVVSGQHTHGTTGRESLVQRSHQKIEESQTTDHHESVSIHAQDADEREPALVDQEAERQSSQVRLHKSEELSAMTNDASLANIRKSSLSVKKPQADETASSDKLIEWMRVQLEEIESVPSMFTPRVSSVKQEIKPRRLINDLQHLSSSTEIPQRVREEALNITLSSKSGSAFDEDDADGGTAGRESIVVGSQQKTEEAPTTDHRETLSVHPEDKYEQDSELDATTQTSQKWPSSAEELIAATNEEPLTSIQESPLPIMEEPSEGGYIEGAKSQEDQMSARVETRLKGIYKATEETEHDEHETARLSDEQEQTPDKPEGRIHDIHRSEEEILRGDTHPGKPSSQLQEEQKSDRPETPLKGIEKATEEREHDEHYTAKLVVRLAPSPTKTPVKDIHVEKEVTTQEEHYHERLSDEQEQTLETPEEPIQDVRQSAEEQYVQHATDEELHKDRVRKKIIIKQKPIEPESTTTKQVGPSLIQERMRQLQQLGKPSVQLQPVSATSDKSKQVIQPATDEELRKQMLLKEKPISSVSTTSQKIDQSFVQERLRGFQQRGKPSARLKTVSATSGESKQGVQPAKDEELHKGRFTKEISKPKPLAPWSKPSKQVSSSLMPSSFEQQGKPSGQVQSVSATSVESELDVQPATDEELRKDRPPKETIKQKPISPVSTTSNKIGQSFVQERLRGFQHRGKPSARLQTVSATSGESKQDVQPATDKELHKGRFTKEIIKPKPLAPWSKPSKQVSSSLMPSSFEQQGKPSGQVQSVSATSVESEQDVQPATDEELRRNRPPKETIKQKPISPVSTTSKKIRQSFVQERLRGFQQRGKPSARLQPVSATSGESKQDVQPAKDEEFHKGRFTKEIIKPKPLAPWSKPSKQVSSSLMPRGFQQSEKPFGNQQPVSGTSGESKQDVKPETDPELHKASLTKEIIKPKQFAPFSISSKQIGSSLIPRGFQQHRKTSGPVQPVPATSGESKQDVHPGTKGTLQMDRVIEQEPISSGSTTYKQGVHPVTEQTVHGGLNSKIPFARQDRYAVKLQIPVSGTHSAKEEASQSRTSPGVFPVGQESVSPKPAGQSTIRAAHAPAQLRVRPALKSPVQAEPKRVMPTRGIASKLQFWQEQEKTASPSKASPKGIHRTNQDRERHLKKSSAEKEQTPSKPGPPEERSSEDD